MISVKNITYRAGTRPLFEEASVFLSGKQRIGLVGKNGSGKTTLLRILMNEAETESGEVRLDSVNTAYLRQEIPDSSISLIDFVLSADKERTELLQKLEDSSNDGVQIAEIHERLNIIEAHSAPAKAASILSGLGFSEEQQHMPLDSFSGGWRMRVALASVLFIRSDLMLLDEPTNHLDLEATIWLESFLIRYAGTLVIISHDKNILNRVCNRIVHIENKKLVSYGGNYDSFYKTRCMKAELAEKAFAKQKKQREKIEKFINRFRYKASKARQAQSRIKMLERMETIIPVIDEKSISFDFPEPEQLPPPLIDLKKGVAGYDGKPVLKRLDMRIDMDDRIALLGANGNGKSTFAKILSGRLELMEGEIKASPKMRTGYFAQHQMEELEAEDTPFSCMKRYMPKATPSKVRAHIGRFGFEHEKSDIAVKNLSGGEKARLLLAMMCYEKPNILILDEPTNHLDIDSREALVEALNHFEGAVILITHDAHLIEMVADRLWLVNDGMCKPYDGDMEDYRKLLIEQSRSDKKESSARNSRKEERKNSAEKRKTAAPLRKQAKKLEQEIGKLGIQKEKIEKELQNPALYSEKNSSEKLTDLKIKLSDTEKLIAEKETDWLSLEEQIEEITG